MHLLVFTLCMLVEVKGDYKIDVLVEHYQNPTHTQSGGSCCRQEYEHFLEQCTDCYNRFTFCARQNQTGKNVFSADNICPTESKQTYVTGIVGKNTGFADNMSFKDLKYIDKYNNITNPLVFTREGSWPGSFQFSVAIKNWESDFREVLVDYVVTNWTLPLNAQFTQRKLVGVNRRAILLVAARVECTGVMLCNNCTQICRNSTVRDSNSSKSNKIEGASLKSESPGNINTTYDSSISANSLIIGLSVGGGLILFLVLAGIIIIAGLCCRRKRNESSRSERKSFLHNNLPKGESPFRIQQIATDEEDSNDDSDGEVINTHYGGGGSSRRSNLYQISPASSKEETIYAEIPENEVPQNDQIGQASGDRRETSITAEYAIIKRQDLTLSSVQSLSDIAEASGGEELERDRNNSVYSVITHEQMGDHYSNVSEAEASLSEDEDRDTASGTEKDVTTLNRPRLPSPEHI